MNKLFNSDSLIYEQQINGTGLAGFRILFTSVLLGANWVKYTFRTNAPSINDSELNKGLRDFSAFWAFKNNVSLIDSKFILKIKKIRVPAKWEADLEKKNAASPWVDGGYFEWKNNEYKSHIKDIESI